MFLADERELSPSAYQHRQTVNMMFLADERELSPPHKNKKSRKAARSAELIPSESTSFEFLTALREIKSSREGKTMLLCPMAAYSLLSFLMFV